MINSENIINFDDLLTKSKNGDNEAIKNLYIELKKPIFILALSILNDYYAAEDILQETFIKVMSNPHGYKSGSNAKAWIFTVTRNMCLNYIKKNKKEELKEEFFEKSDEISITENIESSIEFLRMIEPLEKDEKQIIALRLSARLSYKQIAEILNLSILNSRAKYSRGIKKLRKIIK